MVNYEVLKEIINDHSVATRWHFKTNLSLLEEKLEDKTDVIINMIMEIKGKKFSKMKKETSRTPTNYDKN